MFVCKLVYLVLIFHFCGLALTDDLKDKIQDSKAHSDRGGLWFGPRLGKRSMRNGNGDSDRQLLLKLLEAADALKYYYDQLPYDRMEEERSAPPEPPKPKMTFTPILGRSVDDRQSKRTTENNNMDFTPRLGRRLSDDMPVAPFDYDRVRDAQLDKSMYFTPRLGRTLPFSLGREVAYGIYPDRVRFVRSVKAKQT